MNRARLVLIYATAVLPLFVGWVYQRFTNPPNASLASALPLLMLNVSSCQVKLIGDLPAFKSTVYRLWCQWETPEPDFSQHVDLSPSYNSMFPTANGSCTALNMNVLWEECMVNETSRTLWPEVNVNASANLASNLQLLVYAGFLFYCLFLLHLEQDENLHVVVAYKLGTTYDPTRGEGWRQKATKFVAIAIAVLLGTAFAVTLWKGQVIETFVVFSNRGWFQMLKGVESYERYALLERPLVYLGCVNPSILFMLPLLPGRVGHHLTGIASSAALDPGVAVVLQYTYDASNAFGFALLQGLLFIASVVGMLQAQRKLYDFVDVEKFFESRKESHLGHVEEGSVDCPYSGLFSTHDSTRRIGKREVEEYLYCRVDLPFLHAVQQAMPGLFYELLNEHEAEALLEHIEGFEERESAGEL